MLDPELIEMLCCPESRQDLRLATPDELERLNQAILGRHLRDLSGELVESPISDALVRVDNERIYLVRQDIPIMLPEKAVPYEAALTDNRYQPKTS